MQPVLQVKNIAKEFPGVKALEDISIVNTQIHLVEDTPSFPVMNAVQQPVTLAGLTAEHVRGLHLTDLRIVGAREDEITLRDVE